MFGEFLAAMVGWIWGIVRLFEPVSDLSIAFRSSFFVAVTGGQPSSFRGVFAPFFCLG